MALRSFQEANSMEWRIRCTMQVCTTVSGKTALIASGKPLSPSTTAMRISPMPRFLSSFMTRSQNLAPSEADPLNADRSTLDRDSRGPLRPIHSSDANMRQPTADRGENSEPGETYQENALDPRD